MPAFLSASVPVGWAGALDATIMPSRIEDETQQKRMELCASVYSGTLLGAPLTAIGDIEMLIKNLLTLESDAPVLELDEAFGDRDSLRLSEIVHRMVKNHPTPAELREATLEFNDKVRAYSAQSKRMESMDLIGPAGLMGTYLVTGDPGTAVFVGLSAWFLGLVLKGLDPSHARCGALIEWVRGVNLHTTPDVVLVSRLRKAAKGM